MAGIRNGKDKLLENKDFGKLPEDLKGEIYDFLGQINATAIHKPIDEILAPLQKRWEEEEVNLSNALDFFKNDKKAGESLKGLLMATMEMAITDGVEEFYKKNGKEGKIEEFKNKINTQIDCTLDGNRDINQGKKESELVSNDIVSEEDKTDKQVFLDMVRAEFLKGLSDIKLSEGNLTSRGRLYEVLKDIVYGMMELGQEEADEQAFYATIRESELQNKVMEKFDNFVEKIIITQYEKEIREGWDYFTERLARIFALKVDSGNKKIEVVYRKGYAQKNCKLLMEEAWKLGNTFWSFIITRIPDSLFDIKEIKNHYLQWNRRKEQGGTVAEKETDLVIENFKKTLAGNWPKAPGVYQEIKSVIEAWKSWKSLNRPEDEEEQ